VARPGRLAVAEVVRKDDVVARRVQGLALAEQLAGEQLAGKPLPDQALALAAGAVQDEHRVADDALLIAPRRAERTVVDAHLGQGFARGEAEVTEDMIPRRRRGILGARCRARDSL